MRILVALAVSTVAASGWFASCSDAREPEEAESTGSRPLLIVAAKRFHRPLQMYVKHKQKQLPTSLIALETVLANSDGVDDPERLKRFLYEQWRNVGLGYVLLVGDADVMPVRFMVLDRITPAAYDYAFYPSDLYYSDLAKADGEFDDWNTKNDSFHAGYFGEVRGEKNKTDPINFDEIDYQPDVAVGRWPVNSPQEVRLLVAKSMRYEQGILDGDKPGKLTAAAFCVDGWVDSRPMMDRAADSLSSPWKWEKHYYADDARDDKTPPPDGAHFSRLLNAGTGLVFHVGHGSDNVWDQCMSTADLPLVRNADRLPIMMSVGCSTARLTVLPPYEKYFDVDGNEHLGTDAGETFDAPPPPPAPYQRGKYNPTSLGELLLRGGPHGAVGYIGCNTGSQPCGITLLEGFTATLGNTSEARLGDCWSGAIRYYVEKERLPQLKPNDDWYPPSIYFQGMKFMLFGDPSLMMPGSDGRSELN